MDGRYRAKRPFIITTNSTLPELAGAGGAFGRICDRIRGRCISVAVMGESKRVREGREAFERLREIIGS